MLREKLFTQHAARNHQEAQDEQIVTIDCSAVSLLILAQQIHEDGWI